MPASHHAVERVLEQACAIDDEGGADDAGALAAFRFLFLEHAVELADFAVGVREQLHAQAVLVAERAVRHAVIHADAEDDRVETRELVLELAEVDRLHRAAGGVIARIEVKNDVLVIAKARQTDDVQVRIGQIEHRSRLPRLQRHSIFSPR